MSYFKTASGMLGIGLLIGATAMPALGQFGQTTQVPRAGWVELRDAARNLRGYVQIIDGSGSARIIFRRADGTPIDISTSRSGAEALPPITLTPLPSEGKADGSADIKLLREQIRVLDQNVQALKNAVYARR